jgi:hypothetical protein
MARFRADKSALAKNLLTTVQFFLKLTLQVDDIFILRTRFIDP